MNDAIGELKIRAELLQKKIEQGDPASLKRLGQVPESGAQVQRRDCLRVIARELGFANWTQAKAILSGEPGDGDFGIMLCPKRCAAHTNLWYRDYAEAAAIRSLKDQYLLGYKRQFVVVDSYYLESLGLPADDPDWDMIGRDWIQPRDAQARSRLYAKLIARLPSEGPL